jgi:acyl-CoA synthetase (NDP forming)
VANPVDLLAAATGTQYERALGLVMADSRIDAVIAVYTPPLVSDPDDIAAAVSAAADGAVKPIVACFLGTGSPPPALRRPGAGGRRVPCLPVPDRAADALARACAYGDWRARPAGAQPHLDGIDHASAKMIVMDALARPSGGGWLDAEDAWALLASYGFPVVRTLVARSEDEAVAAAQVVGYPVALKAAAGRIVHKSDSGGVHLGLADAPAVRGAFRAMVGALGQRMGGASVQPMAGAGVETIVGVVNDGSFGPLVMFGLGGVATDLLADRAFCSPPITDVDASVLVRSLLSSPLLTGYRGSEPVNLAAVEDVVLRAGRLAVDVAELAELDLNPIVVTPARALVLDVKVRLMTPPRRPDPWLRRHIG